MKLNDALLGLLMLIIGTSVVLHAQTFPIMAGMQYGPEFFPTVIGSGMALCGAGMLVSWALARRKGATEPWIIVPDWMGTPLNLARALGILFAVVFYILAAPFLGFILTVFLTAFGLLVLLGNRLWISGVIACILPVVLHLGFSVGLRVPLPRGLIEVALF